MNHVKHLSELLRELTVCELSVPPFGSFALGESLAAFQPRMMYVRVLYAPPPYTMLHWLLVVFYIRVRLVYTSDAFSCTGSEL